VKKAAEQFPLLRDFARGYLHQDLLAEYGDVMVAAKTYVADLGATDRKGLAAESQVFLAAAHDWDTSQLNQRLHAMGSAWTFISSDEFTRVLHLFNRGH
jgi:hypothetical protein